MPNTILYTPTNEQILEIARENPDLNKQIKEDVLVELKNSALKYTQKKLQYQADTAYENLFNEVQKKFFNAGSYNSGKFSASLEAQFTQKIEESISNELNKEFESYLESDEFLRLVKSKVKEKILSVVLKDLDNKILEETKKLIA